MMRLTKIVCTLGPATNNKNGISMLAKAGMNIARLNFSHGSHETHTPTIQLVKDMNKREGRTIGIMLDTKGAEIRTGDRAEPLQVAAGETVVFSHKGKDPKLATIAVNYPEFWKDVKDAEYIILDNGDMIFDAIKIEKDRVVAKARGAGSIGSRRHVNLPGSDVSLPSITDKDWEDIKLACKEKMDYIALSFIRTGAEVEQVRAFAKKSGHPNIQLIAKIENGIAVKNIADIIESSDGVMVARGDLGSEIPLPTLPAVQDDIVDRCRKAGKPVIVATHMLESMIKSPLPTRAEVTDVAYAAKIRTDSTMLSGETAAGKHPLEALAIMGEILEATEKRMPFLVPNFEGATEAEAEAAAVVSLAQTLKTPAIALFTRSGKTARAVSKLRPNIPVIAFTDDADVARRMQILYGVFPIVIPFNKSPEKTAAAALVKIRENFSFSKKSHIAMLSTIQDGDREVHTVQSRILS